MSTTHEVSSRGFPSLLTCQLSAALNDQLFKSALMTWITTREATFYGVAPASMLGLTSALFIAPFFLFSATAGQLADRFDKTLIVRLAKLAELAIMTIAALAFARESLGLMLLALFLLGTHSAVLGPVKYGILPQLVNEQELVKANAFMETGTFLSILGGTVFGATLVLSEHGQALLSLCLLGLACVGFLASLTLPQLQPANPGLRVQLLPFGPTAEILRISKRSRTVFLTILGISWFWMLGIMLLSYLPSYVHDTLHAQQSLVTVLLSLFCVGIALGSLLSERISGKRVELALVPVGAIGMTLCLVDLAFAHVNAGSAQHLLSTGEFFARTGSVRLALDLMVLAMFGGLYTVTHYTLIQARAHPSERARVVAGNNLWNSLFMVVGSLLLTVCTHYELSSALLYGCLAALSALLSLAACLTLPEFLMRLFAALLGRVMYRLRVRGVSNIPEEGPVLLVCNHVSFNDWLVLAGSVKRPIRFVMDHNMAKLPGVSLLLRGGKVIPIAPEHEDKELMERAFVRIAEELKNGEVVCIYPEGKITRTGQLNSFKAGVERIVRETNVRVVPMAVHGLWGSFFSRKDGPAMQKLPRRFRAPLTLQIGTPVAPENASAKRLEGEVKLLLEQARTHRT
jgi:1-acyl-sn-glycerol-3-phosphate acyltransferase